METILMCPECGSTKLVKTGKRKCKKGLVQSYSCNDCYRKTVNPVTVGAKNGQN